ncbi:MAG: response regulator [Candidatus Firestonebacteria bacterium]
MILVVDDEQDICDVLSIFLKTEGYESETAKLGKDAIAKFKDNKPSLVFLDMKLPDLEGVEVLRKLKQLDPTTPVIMITAFRDAERVVNAFRLGAYDCIFKPFDFKYIKIAMLASLGKNAQSN